MYVFTFRKIIDFKWHLNDECQWDDVRASSTRISFGYCKKRELLSPTKKNPKPREYERWQCTFPNCLKDPLRLRNHLRQAHRITDTERNNTLKEQNVSQANILICK